MNNIKMKIGIGVLVLIVAGALVVGMKSSNNTSSQYQNSESTQSTSNTNTITNQNGSNASGTTSSAEKIYSLNEVATHGSEQNCWTTINGNVYDVTSWINKHPGGAKAIISLCGKDGSSAFNGQHGGERRPEAELQTFLIGKLK